MFMQFMDFNLDGAIQEVYNSDSNKELIESLNRTTEEFYRTMGIVFYARYLGQIENFDNDFSKDLLNLIDDHFEKPTFDSWMRLGKISAENLLKNGDNFSIEFDRIAKKELKEQHTTQAKNILKEIYKLRSNFNYKPPKKPQIIHVLEAMRLLRNFRSHQWDDNSILQPLVDTEIKNFVIDNLIEIFQNFHFCIIQPISIKKNYIETIICKNGRKSKLKDEIQNEFLPDIDENYIIYYENENLFEFPSKLINYDPGENRTFIYTNYREGKALFENLPTVGGLKKKQLEFKSIRDIFCIPDKKIYQQQLETHEQKFGKILIEDNVIHNLPKRLNDYIHRKKIEEKLIEKLSHRRLYLTTLDGGGGFGKTETAKEVIWSLIKKDQSYIPQQLNFEYIIWITGKIEYFREGSIEFAEQSFNTLNDLLDSILYVTHHLNFIEEDIYFKKEKVIEILNKNQSTILVLDNLETVSEKDLVWDFLIQLGDLIETEVKILITSRTRGGYADQRLNIRAMETNEAEQLIKNELNKLDIAVEYHTKNYINKIIEFTGSIPLLIRYFVSLLAHGYNIDEMTKKMPKKSENALNFICNYQWNELNKNSKKLLMGIAFNKGILSFAQAKLLCKFSDDEFYKAREELQDRSFLVDTTLMNSKLTLLPPIIKYVKIKLQECFEIEEEFTETKKLIEIPSSSELSNKIQTILFTDDIALTQLFQKAELLIIRGDINEAYQWFNEAVNRFPDNVLGWRYKGDFEYRYLKDDIGGAASFKKAIELNQNDPVSYINWAYWEYDRGKENNRKLNFNKSIELNKKALTYSKNDALSKKIKNHIASAFMKLAYINRDEAFRKNKQEYFKIKDHYFIQVIDILEKNLYIEPVNNQEKYHDIIAYNLLANAYLMLGAPTDSKRKLYDLKAFSYLIFGLKLDEKNFQLLYLVGHPKIKKNLEKINIKFPFNKNAVIKKILENESKIVSEIKQLERN